MAINALTHTAYILPNIHNNPKTHKGPKPSQSQAIYILHQEAQTLAQDCLRLPPTPPPGLRQHQTPAPAGPRLPARHPGILPTLFTKPVLRNFAVREVWRPRQPELSSRNHSVVTRKDTGIPKSISISRLKHSANALPSAVEVGPCQKCTHTYCSPNPTSSVPSKHGL